jgi:predicted CxxxxCH...CXXCH cytochrome family protein
VDLGDGSGQCGACHGRGDDPWPSAGAHPAHKNPTLTVSIDCSNCHVVPAAIMDPTHLDGVVHVTFSSLALARNAIPTWDGTKCSSVACHGAQLPDPTAPPVWNDTSGAAAACGACHGIPPSQHTSSAACDRGGCHGDEIVLTAQGLPLISDSGKTLHVNGAINYGR